MRSSLRWMPGAALLLAVSVLLLASPAVGGPQEESDSQPDVESTPVGDESLESIDEILAEDAAMMAGEGYTYEPGNRRDPFKSLLRGRDEVLDRGPRPPGIPGLLIDEIDLTGIFVTGAGPVAQVQAADREESFLLRVGDQLYDGDVVSIGDTEVIFKQMVDDPSEPKPFRERVKKLNP